MIWTTNYGVLAAPDSAKASYRLETLVRQFEHTVGNNSFFLVSSATLVRPAAGLYAGATPRKPPRRLLRPDDYAEVELNGCSPPLPGVGSGNYPAVSRT